VVDSIDNTKVNTSIWKRRKKILEKELTSCMDAEYVFFKVSDRRIGEKNNDP